MRALRVTESFVNRAALILNPLDKPTPVEQLQQASKTQMARRCILRVNAFFRLRIEKMQGSRRKTERDHAAAFG